MCPIVPTFTCGFDRSNFSFAMSRSAPQLMLLVKIHRKIWLHNRVLILANLHPPHHARHPRKTVPEFARSLRPLHRFAKFLLEIPSVAVKPEFAHVPPFLDYRLTLPVAFEITSSETAAGVCA